MRVFDAATTAYLARRAGNTARVLIRIFAQNRATSEIESLGLWAGEQDQAFTVGGTVQTFYRAAGKIGMDEILAQPGTDLFFTSVTLSPIDQNVRAMIAGYDLRFASVEIYRALFWPETGPAPVSFRSCAHLMRLSVRRPRGISSRGLSVCVAGCRSR